MAVRVCLYSANAETHSLMSAGLDIKFEVAVAHLLSPISLSTQHCGKDRGRRGSERSSGGHAVCALASRQDVVGFERVIKGVSSRRSEGQDGRWR